MTNNFIGRILRPTGSGKQYMAHPKRVPPVIERVLNGKLRLLHPQKYEKVPRHNPHVTLTDSQIQEVIEKTGASKEYIQKVAMYIPGQYLRFAVIKGLACGRCLTCLGLFRKVFWCIICVATRPPALGEAGKISAKPLIKSDVVDIKALRTGDSRIEQPRLTEDYAHSMFRMGLTRTEPSVIPQSNFPEEVNHQIWPVQTGLLNGSTTVAEKPLTA